MTLFMAVASAMTLGARAAAAPLTEPPAPLTALVEGADIQVAQVRAGLELVTDDGLSVKLADLWAPRPARAADRDPAADRIRSRLAGLVAVGPLRSFSGNPGVDRYGDPHMHLLDADGRWINRFLLVTGDAQVDPWTSHAGLLAALFNAEAEARHAGRGLWGAPETAALTAATADRARAGAFRIVTGRVAAVGNSRLGLFLNFGEDWNNDFTVLVPTGRIGALGGHEALRGLVGRTVEARGAVDRWRGPFMRARRPGTLRVLP